MEDAQNNLITREIFEKGLKTDGEEVRRKTIEIINEKKGYIFIAHKEIETGLATDFMFYETDIPTVALILEESLKRVKASMEELAK